MSDAVVPIRQGVEPSLDVEREMLDWCAYNLREYVAENGVPPDSIALVLLGNPTDGASVSTGNTWDASERARLSSCGLRYGQHHPPQKSAWHPVRQFLDFTEDDLQHFTDEEIMEALSAAWAVEDNERYGKFAAMFPDTGPLRRDLYPKHMEFFAAGAQHRERCAMAANRVGKTYGMGGYETTCHLTGDYPAWWPGRRFHHPIKATAAGKTNETTRDIVQTVLLGEIDFEGGRKMVDGTGLIPRDRISLRNEHISWKQGVADLIDNIAIRHKSGGWSRLYLKSYHQGRGAFEGTAMHVIWDDEEPPMDVYNEQLIRTATTRGILYLTFTPLEGMSDVVMQFLPAEMRPEADG